MTNLRSKIEHRFRAYASKRPTTFLGHLFKIFATPFGYMYGGMLSCRLFLYSVGILKCYKSMIPVISVGNITLGGTGKTPFVSNLIANLETKGFRCAVVSRGYGGNFRGSVGLVSGRDNLLMRADECGDEPALLARKHPDAKIFVARKRRIAVEKINSENLADVIILDDAYQHLSVRRDLNILLLDASCPYGNGSVFPAGLLREPKKAINRADLIVLTHVDENNAISGLPEGKKVVRTRHVLDDFALTAKGERIEIKELIDKKIFGFAGIAKPDVFFEMLKQMGILCLEKVVFNDHAKYSVQQIEQLLGMTNKFDYIVTTEKDIVKMTKVFLSPKILSIGVNVEIIDSAIIDKILDLTTINHE